MEKLNMGAVEGARNITYVLVPEVFLGNTLNLCGGNSVDGEFNLLGCHPSAAGDKLPSDILSNGGGSVQAQEHASLELALGPLNFHLRGGNRHSRPLPEGKVGEVIKVHEVLAHEIDTPETSVRIRS